jgi:hypothetical protein
MLSIAANPHTAAPGKPRNPQSDYSVVPLFPQSLSP